MNRILGVVAAALAVLCLVLVYFVVDASQARQQLAEESSARSGSLQTMASILPTISGTLTQDSVLQLLRTHHPTLMVKQEGDTLVVQGMNLVFQSGRLTSVALF